MVKNYSGENFKEVTESKVLVDFYADWCGPCRMLSPILEQVEGIDVLKVNIDKYPELAKKYKVMSIPQLIAFNDSVEIAKNIGFSSRKGIEDFIEKVKEK